VHRLGIALFPILGFGCSDEPRVGIVDVQRAFQSSPLVMVSAHEIKAEMGGVDRDLKRRGRALAALRQRVEHGRPALDAEQRAEIDAQIAAETTALMELQRTYREDLAAARERHGAVMIARVEEVARAVARREGVSLLVRTEGIVYTDEATDLSTVDLTEQVSRALLARINPTEIPAPANE
jgi:Skp family chaperone for outer membrane proteins